MFEVSNLGPVGFATYDDLEHFEPLDQTARDYLLAEKCLLARLNEESHYRFHYDNLSSPSHVRCQELIENCLKDTIKKLCADRQFKSTCQGKIRFCRFRNLAFSTRNKRTFPAVDYAIIFSDAVASAAAQEFFGKIDLGFYYARAETVGPETRYPPAGSTLGDTCP